jgi:hypothetical protein
VAEEVTGFRLSGRVQIVSGPIDRAYQNGRMGQLSYRNRAIALKTQTLMDGDLSQPFLSGASPAANIDLHILKT